MIAVMLYSLYGVIDGLFIGNSTGDVGLAAINIVWPVTAVIIACGIGIGTGGSVLLSYFIGTGDTQRAKEVYGTTNILLVLSSIVLFILLKRNQIILEFLGASGEVYVEAKAYIDVIVFGCFLQVLGSGLLPILRNIGMAVHAMLSMALGLFLNICINYYLMFVVGMGIKGAAYGTVASQCVVVIIAFILLCRDKSFGLYLYCHKQYMLDIIKAGITPFGIYLAPSITLVFTNLQCIRYGGDAAVASYAVISYIVFPTLSMLGGVGDGTQPLTSYYNGANKIEELRKIRRISYLILMIMGIVLTTCSIALSEKIGVWFGLSEAGKEYFAMGMFISALAFLFQGIAKYNGSYLNATMRTKFAVFLTYVESLVISPLLLFILPMIFGVIGIWMSALATSLTIIIIYQIGIKTSHKKHRNRVQ